MFKNRKLIFLSALLMLIVLIGCASAADVNDIQQVTQDSAGEIITDEVSSAGIDDNSGLEELENENVLNSQNEDSDEEVLGDPIDFTGTTFSELRTQISNCNPGDTINLLGNITQDGTGAISIYKNLTINGNGYTIDAQGKSRIFSISRNDVTLKNIVFINGRVNDGRIDADYCGGALYITGNNTSIINCNFTNNTAPSQTYGGDGGAIYSRSIKGLTISNCTFNNNFALGDGGAIYYERCSNDTISNCTFNDNRARYGGAIQFFMSNDTTVSNSTFKNNTACMATNSAGGAIYLRSCNNGTILNCNFTNNNCTGSDATSGGGGAIRIERCNDTNVSNSTFTNNTAWKGGAIHCISTNRTTIADCNFTNNSAIVPSYATSNGGAIFYHTQCSDSVIINGKFINNTANYGSAIASSSNISISDSYFIENQAKGLSIVNKALDNSILESTFSGGDDYINAIRSTQEVTFDNVTFWNGSVVNSDDFNQVNHSNYEAGINLTIEIYDAEGQLVKNITQKTDAEGKIYYDFSDLDGRYEFKVYHPNDTYYTYVERKSTIGPTPELTINKTANESVVGNNSLVNFTIEISNIGKGYARDIYINDWLPYGLELVSASEEFLEYAEDDYISWHIPKLSQESSITLWVVVKTTDYGTFKNQAECYSEDIGGSIYDTATVTVSPVVLTIEKLANSTECLLGDEVTFTINVTNVGVEKATEVIITDILPDGLDLVDGELSYNISSLEAGESHIITIIAKASKAGNFTNNATAYCLENPTVVSDTANVIAKMDAIITVDKIVNYTGAVVEVIANVTDANGNPINGGTATFTIHYDNPIGLGLLMANAKEYTTDVIDGKATFKDITLGAPGKYQSTIEYSGNDQYGSASDKSEVEILALNTTVESDDVSGSSGEKTDIVAEIVDQNGKPVQNGTAVLKVNGKEYTAEVKDGKATFKDVELPSEDTEATIEYLGNDYYNPSNATVQITINEEPQPEPIPDTTPEESGESEGSQTAAMEKTGNPLFLLIVAVLACLPILRRKQ